MFYGSIERKLWPKIDQKPTLKDTKTPNSNTLQSSFYTAQKNEAFHYGFPQ